MRTVTIPAARLGALTDHRPETGGPLMLVAGPVLAAAAGALLIRRRIAPADSRYARRH
jgi:hypothetical protein